MTFDREQYRLKIKQQLEKLPRDKQVIFALRVVLRVLPLLASRKDHSGQSYQTRTEFWYWPKEERSEYLLAVLTSTIAAAYVAVSGKRAAYAANAAAANAAATAAYAADAAAAYAADTAYAVYAVAYADITAAANAANAAAAYAYAAAFVTDDYATIVQAIVSDLTALARFKSVNLLTSPLWISTPPQHWKRLLSQFKIDALSLGAGFDVWLDWYYDRIQGKSFDLKLLERWLSVPYEIKSQGAAAVNTYLTSLVQAKNVAPLNRVRAIFIGYGESGKTSLIRKLFKEAVVEGIEPMTAGIEIREWTIPKTDIKALCWDFGGQVMAHASHQFFLRSSCLYVVVLDGRKEVNGTEQAEYWLEHVKSFGHGAPVMLVGNKADQAEVLLDLAYLKQKYPNIIGFFSLSCTKAQEPDFAHKFKEFHQQFCTELKKVGTHQMLFTQPQFEVLQKLREKARARAFISHEDFKALCLEHSIGDEGVQNRAWLLDILDKLGVVIHFPNLPWLEDYVLNPRWLTYGVYTLIYHGKARLTEAYVAALLSRERVVDETGQALDYPKSRCRFIMDAMREFKLCYYLPKDPNTLIIPALLPSDQPRFDFDIKGGLAFEFVFRGFLPRHVLPELIVRRHEEIENQTVWQHGVLLKHRELKSRALLRADYHERVLFIWVQGRDAKDYLHLLRDDVLGILSRLQIDYEELITLPLETAMNVDPFAPRLQAPEKANYQQILNSYKAGIFKFPGKFHVYDLKKLLGLILPDEKFEQINQYQYIYDSTIGGSVIAAKTISDSIKGK